MVAVVVVVVVLVVVVMVVVVVVVAVAVAVVAAVALSTRSSNKHHQRCQQECFLRLTLLTINNIVIIGFYITISTVFIFERGCDVLSSKYQRLQYPLIKKYFLNRFMDPTIV